MAEVVLSKEIVKVYVDVIVVAAAEFFKIRCNKYRQYFKDGSMIFRRYLYSTIRM